MKFRLKEGAALLVLGLWWSGASASSFQVKCLTDDGKILGGDSSNTCKNTLPKCSEIKAALQKAVQEQLSMKIYGYYKGYDVDLKKTTLDSMSGSKMPVQICSVVGHSIRYKNDRDLEFGVRNYGGSAPYRGDTQAINGASCGEAPQIQLNTDDRKVLVNFVESSGSRWSSWMLGTMPYLIRANSYRFFQGLSDMSKLDSLVNSPVSKALKEEYAQLNSEIESFFKQLPLETKATCEDSAYGGIVDSCLKKPGAKEFLPTDPALRTCEIVKAQLTMSGGSLSNIVLGEIMEDARAEYDKKVGSLLKSGSPGWQALVNKASDGTAWTDCWLSARRKCGAVAISGMMGSGFYRVSESYAGYESDDSGKKNRKGERFIAFYLDRPSPEATMAWGPPQDGGPRMRASPVFPDWWENFLFFWRFLKALHNVLASRDVYLAKYPAGNASLTLASGFPGLIEYTVRNQICGQRSVSDSSLSCDEQAIPDKPAGVKW
ncbi:hypothetical protein EB061_03895 [bacterium]|jgi:hypothetical protein|nr:hypothetical protein [bacterium]